MKKLKYFIGLLFATLILTASCEEDSYEFGSIINPTNISLEAEIIGQDTDNPYGDGSGTVTFSASAQDVITYKFIYDGQETMAPSGEITFNFGITGIHKYTVTVVAIGTGGVSSSKSIEVEVLALYAPPADLLTMLTDNETQTWRIKNEAAGHMGVGPAEETVPIWWAAAPDDKASTAMYDDRYVFNADGTFTHLTQGAVFGQANPLSQDLGGDKGQTPNGNNEYEYYPLDDYSGSWALSAPGGQETLSLTDNGFFGFYVGGSHSYTILSRSATEMSLKTIGADGLAWFFILTTEEPPSNEASVDVTYTNLVWADEFDVDGQPNTANWTYDLGTGNNGWGNAESQTYTDRSDNVTVSGGTLKITAKKESYNGAEYTSARLKSQGLFDFKYGRIDVRAKLPEGGGTWPAIWMLGANFENVGWPATGEIDIMEHAGNNPNVIHGSIHTPSSYGATENTNTTNVANVSSEFHVYSVNWSENEISFLVDDEIFYTYNPETKDADTWPFDANQFIILNVAMGGTFGGGIDAAFTESTMEIDYVRVYQ